MRKFGGWPSLLAGPIVRRSDRHIVNLWFATSEPLVFSGKLWIATPTGLPVAIVAQFSISERWQLGQNLYVHMLAIGSGSAESFARVAVLQDAINDAQEGRHIFYEEHRASNLRGTSDFPAEETLAYTVGASIGDESIPLSQLVSIRSIAYGRDPVNPTLILQDIGSQHEDFRVLYGSCRKLHGAGDDATLSLEDRFAVGRLNPGTRHYSLFFGGDQIYADDVAGHLIVHIATLSKWLMDTEEYVPNIVHQNVLDDGRMGLRGELLRGFAKFSTTSGENHLIRFGEYVAMYLLAWNDELWPSNYASHQTLLRHQYVSAGDYSREDHNRLEQNLSKGKAGSVAIRRLMANVPTYMIFDDHEVTDDWFINTRWQQRVMGTRLGKAVISNGLAAYWAFQGWGNSPASFNTAFKRSVSEYLRSQNSQARVSYFQELNDFAAWSFVTPSNPPAVFLDTRTKRAQAGSASQGAKLISDAELGRLRTKLISMNLNRKPLIVVTATPVLGVPLIEGPQSFAGSVIRHTNLDLESFASNPRNYSDFFGLVIASRANPVVILSGDVHYGFSIGARLFAPTSAIKLAQFTSSALKNRALRGLGFAAGALSTNITSRFSFSFEYQGHRVSIGGQFTAHPLSPTLTVPVNNMGELCVGRGIVENALYARSGNRNRRYFQSQWGAFLPAGRVWP